MELTGNSAPPLRFAWLEITGKCNLQCVHCYADSGPAGPPDTVGVELWFDVIGQLAELGVQMVQFIGGEPTLHPQFDALVTAALGHGLKVEVYTNLTHVSAQRWSLFRQDGICLATSFYSSSASTHEAVTKGKGSHAATLTNIQRAIEFGIPIRVGMAEVVANQGADEAAALLRSMGITNVRIDRMRGIGRGREELRSPDPLLTTAADDSQLCGHCTSNRLAIDPAGLVFPCVFSRWLPVGNVKEQSIAEINRSPTLASVRSELDASFRSRRGQQLGSPCDPSPCDPSSCPPAVCSPDRGCGPDIYCPPTGPCGPLTPCGPDLRCAPFTPPPPQSFREDWPVAVLTGPTVLQTTRSRKRPRIVR